MISQLIIVLTNPISALLCIGGIAVTENFLEALGSSMEMKLLVWVVAVCYSRFYTFFVQEPSLNEIPLFLHIKHLYSWLKLP